MRFQDLENGLSDEKNGINKVGIKRTEYINKNGKGDAKWSSRRMGKEFRK